jgi:hypothetical protein
MVDLSSLRGQGLSQIASLCSRVRRVEIAAWLAQQQGSKVSSGPFLGMELLEEVSWADGDLVPKLLGCYEEELHPAITNTVARNPAAVVNVGCAEGYYAVGFARLLPQARIISLDTDPKAQTICRRAAEVNAVGNRLRVGGPCRADGMRELVSESGPTLLFVDCEGAETQILDPLAVPELRRCDIIVECHDFLDRSITSTLSKRLSSTHHIENIIEGARNPNRFPLLRHLASADRWLAVNEDRPQMMNWLVCWAR